MKLMMMIASLFLVQMPTYAADTLAETMRVCDRVPMVGTDSDYILRCIKRDDLIQIQQMENSARLYRASPDVMATLMQDDRYIYVNVITESAEDGMAGQTCYRVVREIDNARDGFYAVQECEYNNMGLYN